MANPQVENGHTQISNEILEELIRLNISSQELRAALFVIRKTYGFKKKEDFISLSQFAKAMLINKTRASFLIKKLCKMKILTVTQNINGIGKKYRFNKDYEQWDTVTQNINRYAKRQEPLRKSVTVPLRKSITTKESIKETNTKENIYTLFKKYKEIFKGVYEPRKLTPKIETKIRARLKEFSKEELILALKKIRADDFVTGKNQNSKVYCTPEYCFRSYEMIEKWLNQKENKQLDPYQNAKTY